MIQLTCTYCQTVLSIDEGFAGGVCRCQHCGTIQTVPANLKSGSAVGVEVSDDRSGSRSGQKALYQNKQREVRPDSTGSGTGLDDLASVVAGSGLSNSGLSTSFNKAKRLPRQDAKQAAVQGKGLNGPLLFGGGAVAAAVIGLLVWLLVSSLSKPGQDTAQNTATPGPNQPNAVVEPTFLGEPIKGSTVVYLLDRGESAKDVFDAEKEAAYASILSLGPDRKFQLLLWDNHTPDVRFPANGTTFATPQNLDACKRTMEDVVAYRQSDIKKPLINAMSCAPDSVVIVTAKGFELDDRFVSDVLGIRKDAAIRLYTFSLKGQESSALQTLAQKTGGAYKVLTDGALHAAIQ